MKWFVWNNVASLRPWDKLARAASKWPFSSMMIQSASMWWRWLGLSAVGVVSNPNPWTTDGTEAAKLHRQKDLVGFGGFFCCCGAAGVYMRKHMGPLSSCWPAIWICAPSPFYERRSQRGTKGRFNYGLGCLPFRYVCVFATFWQELACRLLIPFN